jgi:hypothetical protein
MSWAAVTASPAGSTTQFQYNNAGSLAGASNLTFATNGPVVTSLGVGSTTPSASGAGIAFPATQSASSDANTLDDYEEGTWTPVIEGTSTTGTATYSSQTGKYTKIGRQVTVTCYVDWSGGTGTGNMKFSGLPFNDTFGAMSASITYQSGLTLPVTAMAFVNAGATNTNGAFFWSIQSGGGNVALLAYDAAAILQFTCTYFTAT